MKRVSPRPQGGSASARTSATSFWSSSPSCGSTATCRTTSSAAGAAAASATTRRRRTLPWRPSRPRPRWRPSSTRRLAWSSRRAPGSTLYRRRSSASTCPTRGTCGPRWRTPWFYRLVTCRHHERLLLSDGGREGEGLTRLKGHACPYIHRCSPPLDLPDVDGPSRSWGDHLEGPSGFSRSHRRRRKAPLQTTITNMALCKKRKKALLRRL